VLQPANDHINATEAPIEAALCVGNPITVSLVVLGPPAKRQPRIGPAMHGQTPSSPKKTGRPPK
jgi:hypothetical protein